MQFERSLSFKIFLKINKDNNNNKKGWSGGGGIAHPLL